MIEESIAPPYVEGEYEVYRIDEVSGEWELLFTKKNLIMYFWGFAVAKALGQGDSDYKINAAYLEFKNVALPADLVAVPSFTRGDGFSYFNGLAADQDFLRVALNSTPTIDIATGFESYFTAGVDGNRLTFECQTTGTVGVLGRTFDHTVNSKVFGMTLVATPLFTDRSQDVLFARGYFDTGDQTLKTAGSQIGVRWKISFK